MTLGTLIDNDIIVKIAAYDLGDSLAAATTVKGSPPGMLSVGRFVVRDRLSRAKRFSDGKAALAAFEQFLPHLVLLEPTADELAIAADFETEATKANLELDGGESQLLAILLLRAAELLITGDKRAIVAIAGIAASAAKGKIACFEQVMATLVVKLGAGVVQSAVCAEPLADKAMAICCGCASGQAVTAENVLSALESYVSHLRKGDAGTLLAENDLSALAA